MTSPDRETWDAVVRPHRTPLFAYGAAFLIAAAHIAVGLLLKVGSTGVVFQTSDQVAIAALGLVIACVALLFARPRLRVGPVGVSVRNLLGDKLIEWPMLPACRSRWATAGLESTCPTTSTYR